MYTSNILRRHFDTGPWNALWARPFTSACEHPLRAERDQCGSALSALWHVLCNFTLLLWLLLLPLSVSPQTASSVAVRHIPRHQERNISHGTRAFLRCPLQHVKVTVGYSRTSALNEPCICRVYFFSKVKGQWFVPTWKLFLLTDSSHIFFFFFFWRICKSGFLYSKTQKHPKVRSLS